MRKLLSAALVAASLVLPVRAQAATANFTDMSILATDTVFGNRVQAALTVFCWNTVLSESITAATLAQHIARKTYCVNVLNSPSSFKPIFVNLAAANQTVANDATAGGTLVGMTGTQVATAAASVLDTDISNAIAAAFNAFVNGI